MTIQKANLYKKQTELVELQKVVYAAGNVFLANLICQMPYLRKPNFYWPQERLSSKFGVLELGEMMQREDHKFHLHLCH